MFNTLELIAHKVTDIIVPRKRLMAMGSAVVLTTLILTYSLDEPENALAKEEENYTVQSGDNLWRISLNHGITLADLMTENNLSDDLIQPGQGLVIPKKDKTEETDKETEEAAPVDNSTIYGNELTSDQYQVLLEVVQQESGGQNYDAILAVMSVITNRVDTDWHKESVWEVITAPGQFEAYGAGHYTRHRGQVTDVTKEAVNDALDGKKNVRVLNFWSDWYYADSGRTDEEAVNIGGNVFFDL